VGLNSRQSHEAFGVGSRNLQRNEGWTSSFILAESLPDRVCFGTAAQNLNDAVSLAHSLGNREIEMQCHCEVSEYEGVSGQSQQSEKSLNFCLSMAVESNDILWHGRALSGLGQLDAQVGKTDLATVRFNEARNLLRQAGDSRFEALTVARLAELERQKGQNDLARQHYLQAFDLIKNGKNAPESTHIMLGLAEIERITGDYLQAKGHYEEVQQLCQSHNDQLCQANAFLGLGDTQESLGDYASARRHYGQAHIQDGTSILPWSSPSIFARRWFRNKVVQDFPLCVGKVSGFCDRHRSAPDTALFRLVLVP